MVQTNAKLILPVPVVIKTVKYGIVLANKTYINES